MSQAVFDGIIGKLLETGQTVITVCINAVCEKHRWREYERGCEKKGKEYGSDLHGIRIARLKQTGIPHACVCVLKAFVLCIIVLS